MAVAAALGCLIGRTAGTAPVQAASASPPPPAAGEATPAPAPIAVPARLSLKECLELALDHNANFQQSLVSLANAESRQRATRQLNHGSFESLVTYGHTSRQGYTTVSTFGPSVSMSRPNGSSFTGLGTVPAYTSPRSDGSAALDYTLPLIRGSGRGSETRAQLVQAQIDVDRTRLSHFDDEQGLIQAVAEAYFNAIRAQNLLLIQEEAVRIAEQSTSDSQKKLDAGLIIEIELTRAQLQLSRTRGQLLSQQQQAHNALDALVLIMGLPVGAEPELTDPVTYDYKPIDEAASIQTALERRPELSQVKLQQADADVQIALAQSHKKPRADLNFNFLSLGFNLLNGTGLANVLTTLLGLRVSVPVRERPLKENLAQAERNRAILDDEYEFRRQGIVNEVRQLVRSAETEKNNIDLLVQQQEVDKQNLRSAQRLFEEGLGSNRDLLDAQSSQTQTDSAMLSAKVDFFLTMISLQNAMGLSLRDHFHLPETSGSRQTREAARSRTPVRLSELSPSDRRPKSGAKQP